MADDADIGRVERNVRRMIAQQAPEADIDSYLKSEGHTPASFREAVAFAKAPKPLGETVERVRRFAKGVSDEIASGTALGTADELGAASTAAGQSLFGWKNKNGQPLTPGSSFGERYDAALAKERGDRRTFAANHPVVATLANIVGSVGGFGNPIAASVATATNALPRVLQYAAQGAVPGAVYGFGEGEGGFLDRLKSAGIGAAAGGALGAATGIATDTVSNAARRLFPPQPPPIVNAQGQLTPEAIDALQRAGIDPAVITQGFQQEFARQAQAAAAAGKPLDPVQLARQIQGQTLPVPVMQTQGQVSGTPSAQMFENLAAKGVYGPQSERFMRGVQTGQQDALRGNVDAIATQIGGAPVRTEGQIPGRLAQDRLAAMRNAERQGVDAAYDAARATTAGVPADAVAALRGDIADAVGANHSLGNIPKVTNVLGGLDRIGSGQNASVPINELFKVRQQLTNAARNGGEEAVAATTAKTILDRHVDDMVARGLLSGDENAIAAWQKAIAANRDFAARFKGADLVQSLTDRDFRSGVRQLVVPPDQATNVIFGAKQLFGGQNTARDLTRLRSVLGEQSPEWQGIRQEAAMRLFNKGLGPVDPTTGVRNISGANFAKALDDAMRNDPEIMRTLFSNQELALLHQFRNVASRVTTPVRGGDNTSNTAVAGANIVQNLLGRLFTSEQAAMKFMAIPMVRQLVDYGAGFSLAGRVAGRPGMAMPPQRPPVYPGKWVARPASGVLLPMTMPQERGQ